MREFKVGDYIRVKTEFIYQSLEEMEWFSVKIKVGMVGKIISTRERGCIWKYYVMIYGFSEPIPFSEYEMEKITKTDYLIGIL